MSCLRPAADLTNFPKGHKMRSICLHANALQVLYLDVDPGDGQQQLVALAGAVREHFNSQGIIDDGQWPFTPHVTIAKMSNITSFGARKSVGKIPEVTAFLFHSLQIGLWLRAKPAAVSMRPVHPDMRLQV